MSIEKCFSIGMDKDLIRASRSCNNQNELNFKKRKSFSPVVIHTLDLLENDRSLLTTDQWSSISNIINSFDERNQLSQIKEKLAEQSNYPAKFRLKMAHEHMQSILFTLFRSIEHQAQTLSQFQRISSTDQTSLIQRNIRSIGGIAGFAFASDVKIYSNLYYFNATMSIYGSKMFLDILKYLDQLDSNVALSKLFTPIFLFSTASDAISPTFDNNNGKNFFENQSISNRLFDLSRKKEEYFCNN